jgi:hypothetical protein
MSREDGMDGRGGGGCVASTDIVSVATGVVRAMVLARARAVTC